MQIANVSVEYNEEKPDNPENMKKLFSYATGWRDYRARIE